MLNDTLSASKSITLVHGGEDYFSRLERIILDAQFEIHIQIYIFDDDFIGNKIAEALKNAASRNVKIYLLLDGFGSKSLSEEFIEDFRRHGINVRLFAPLFSASSFYIGRRLHHKVVVADAKVVLIGGINIADKYHGTPTVTPWLDYAVQLNNEQIAAPLQELCLDIYYKKRQIRRKKIESVFYTTEEIHVSILQNDWLKKKNEINNAYIKSIRNSKKEIIIVGSYFLPGRKLIGALKKASQNKVTIKLILSGISDVPLLRGASLHFYSKILRYNIEIYEWDKSVMHGKAAVIDSHWTTIGSFNLNNLSSYGSIEMNVEINSATFSKTYLSHLNQIISQCQRVTSESLITEQHYFSKFLNWLCYWLIRIITVVLTYLPYKRFMRL
ncbi:phospholipase D-like domain-containing protein [Flavobacterium sp.]|uniref:phospholipase D-like domain-containing protein n=1 Tax=Flavobacterium sp. TaxID=239 RepID=UPI002B4B029C|nr:phospholipase D-like domain-containing protein [Flavobacterium sp.]HLF53329.1 phospholipase D-like domain-containing protein [Flavobacterium sp.]